MQYAIHFSLHQLKNQAEHTSFTVFMILKKTTYFGVLEFCCCTGLSPRKSKEKRKHFKEQVLQHVTF